MHKLLCISSDAVTDITPVVGSIEWRSSVNELGEQLNFNIIFNDDRYFPNNPVDIGSMIKLINKEEIFRGIVISEYKNGRGVISYTCFDDAFYLNKSKEVYQFYTKGKKAIETILNDFSVPIGSIAPISTVINKIYNDMTLSSIIKDILDITQDETGIKYRMEMRKGRLYIENQKDLLIKPTFKFAQNIQPYDVARSISNPSRKRSIENMKNSVKIMSGNRIMAEVMDSGLVNKYGRLQEVRTVDVKNSAQAKLIAKNILKEFGKIFEDNSVEMIGSDEVRAGKIIEIEEPVTGMSGQYLIKNVRHTLKNGIHRMNVGLGVI